MPKAYLAYSWDDQRLVREVAKGLTKVQCHFDETAFHAGDDFRDAIGEHLDDTGLFVFFASKSSLESVWARYEMDEANWRLLHRSIASALTFIVDDKITTGDLPPWMRRSLVRRARRSQHIIRAIRLKLFRLRGLSRQIPFVGRESDLSVFARGLIPQPERKPPTTFVFVGLEGVGRRTFAQHVLRNNLSLTSFPTITLEDTDTPERLHFLLLQDVFEYSSLEELADEVQRFQAMSPQDRGQTLASYLQEFAEPDEIPFIEDRGALLDESGRYRQEISTMLSVLRESGFPVVLLHRRMPQIAQRPSPDFGSLVIQLKPLSEDHTKLLVQQSLKLAGVTASIDQIETIASRARGYPPAVEMATVYALQYGVDVLVDSPALLADFAIETFAPLLTTLALTSSEEEMLRLMVNFPQVPLELLEALLPWDAEEATAILRRLMDYNLVLNPGDKLHVSPPVRLAVERQLGPYLQSEYQEILRTIKENYWQPPAPIPALPVIDATIHASIRAKDDSFTSLLRLRLPSHLYSAAIEQYNAQNWQRAVDLGEMLVALAPDHVGCHIMLCKAFVRLDQGPAAEKELAELERVGSLKRFYCKGFMQWKAGKFDEAIDSFRAGIAAGDASIPVWRDLANCLHLAGRSAEAVEVLQSLPKQTFSNPFVLDLAAKIATETGRLDEAERYVELLERFDKREGFLRRSAVLRAAQGDLPRALRDAKEAASVATPMFETRTVYIDLLIRSGELAEAESQLNSLRASSVRTMDVRAGLRCNYWLARGSPDKARNEWEELHDKHSSVALYTLEAIEGARQGLEPAARTGAIVAGILDPEELDEVGGADDADPIQFVRDLAEAAPVVAEQSRPRELLTTGQAAIALGVSDQTVRNWLASGRLPAVKRGLRSMIPREAVWAEIERSRVSPGQTGPDDAAQFAWRRDLLASLSTEVATGLESLHDKLERGEELTGRERSEMVRLEREMAREAAHKLEEIVRPRPPRA